MLLKNKILGIFVKKIIMKKYFNILSFNHSIIQSLLFVFLILHSITNTFAVIEQYKADSLENILKTAKGKKKIELLNELSKEYSSTSYEKSLDYANQALSLAEKSDNKKEKANALHNIGEAYKLQNKNIKALESHQKSLKIRKQINDKKVIAISLNNIGII